MKWPFPRRKSSPENAQTDAEKKRALEQRLRDLV
jgi:hypothetical protein